MSEDEKNTTPGHPQPSVQTPAHPQPVGTHDQPLRDSAKSKPLFSAPAKGMGAVHLTFDQAKVVAKKTWNQLNDADFAKAEGSVDKLYGIIQAKIGMTRDAIQMKLEKSV